MPEEHTDGYVRRKRGSRGRGGKVDRQTCFREGCGRTRPSNHTYCNHMCRLVDWEVEAAQRVCADTGDTELWLAAVALNDALTDYHTNDSRVYFAARDVGITDAQWRTVKHGSATDHDTDDIHIDA